MRAPEVSSSNAFHLTFYSFVLQTERSSGQMTSFLRVPGTKIIDGEGKEVTLRGAVLGEWMK